MSHHFSSAIVSFALRYNFEKQHLKCFSHIIQRQETIIKADQLAPSLLVSNEILNTISAFRYSCENKNVYA